MGNEENCTLMNFYVVHMYKYSRTVRVVKPFTLLAEHVAWIGMTTVVQNFMRTSVEYGLWMLHTKGGCVLIK